jgi:hypothetical protein
MFVASAPRPRVNASTKALAMFALGLITGGMLVSWSPGPPATTASIHTQLEQVSER